MIYRKRKKVDDVKKYVKTVNPDLPGQQIQKGYFKEAILEWKTGGYSKEDKEAWNFYSRANRILASGFNMFSRYNIGASVDGKTWKSLTNCTIYDVKGTGFKVDINVDGDYSGKLYFGTSKLYMKSEVLGVYSTGKYTFDVTGLSILTGYYFYIKNTSEGKEGRTGIYSQKTTEYIPVPIYIGNPAVTGSYLAGNRTSVDKCNPANATGKITHIELYSVTNLSNVKVATFFVVSGNYLSTRGYQFIGSVAGGSKQTRIVNIDVVEGDLIGIFYSTVQYGLYYKSEAPGSWFNTGDYIPCENESFGEFTYGKISLFGEGIG